MLKVSDNFKKSCNSDNLKYREFIIIDNKEIDIYFHKLNFGNE